MTRSAAASNRAPAKEAKAPAQTAARRMPRNYLERSELPITSLLFLLPLLIAYEVGTAYYAGRPELGIQPILAFSLMQRFFLMFGANAQHLPALAVVVLLLSWHIARNDPWTLHPKTCIAMAVESCATAIPLVIIGYAVMRYVPPVTLMTPQQATGLVVLSLGAGVYEELVFRLIAFTALSFLLRDLMKIPALRSQVLMVVGSAVLFSLYHYLGSEDFALPSFAFRTVAGVYFGALFLTRGFGVTAGCHAAYDIFINLHQAVARHLV